MKFQLRLHTWNELAMMMDDEANKRKLEGLEDLTEIPKMQNARVRESECFWSVAAANFMTGSVVYGS